MLKTALREKNEELIKDFVREIQNVFHADLTSIVLYGSILTEEFVERYSNINVLIVLKSADIQLIKEVEHVINTFKFRVISPIFMTEDYIQKSLDTFPIEYLDIKENYELLFGNDIVKDFKIDFKNLRFQCEFELKAKLLMLKNQYIKLLYDKVELENLLFKSFNSILHIMRNVLRLKNITTPYEKIEILRQMALELQIPITVWKKILEAKTHPAEVKINEVEPLLIDFIKELEKIIEVADRL